MNRRASVPYSRPVRLPPRRVRPGTPDRAAEVLPQLRLTAGYVWRLMLLLVAVYLVFAALGRVALAVLAVFGALVLTALLRPLVDLLARGGPRPLAVAVSLALAWLLIGGIVAFIGVSIAGQVGTLVGPFQEGVAQVLRWLSRSPLHVRVVDLDAAVAQGKEWLLTHRGALANQVVGRAGSAAEVFAGLLIAVFCAAFFLNSGREMWAWFVGQVPARSRGRWDAAARAGWATFEGYARGTIIVAASNAAVVTVALLALRVPLAVPLALLVFVASFVPLVGGVFSLAVATLVALAARGPAVAALVLVLIVVVGQLEGHVFQPLIMSRSVRLHPVVVLLSVTCGTLLGDLAGAIVAVPLVAVSWSVLSALRGYPRAGGPAIPARPPLSAPPPSGADSRAGLGRRLGRPGSRPVRRLLVGRLVGTAQRVRGRPGRLDR